MCWKFGPNTSNNHATCTVYQVWSGQGTQSLSYARHATKVRPTLVYTPQTLSTARILSVSLRFIMQFEAPAAPKTQHHEHHRGSLAPISFLFLLDTTHNIRFQHSCQNPRYVEVSKNGKCGPIVLMMLARKKLPELP